jgi:hypothetical protein
MTTAVVMTYNSLVLDIEHYLERTDADTLSQIPRFISLAELIIAANLKFLGNLVVATGNLTLADPILVKPAGWRKTVSMNITVNDKKQPVFLRKYEVLRTYAPDADEGRVPKYYADYDYDHWLVAPTPDAPYEFEVTFYGIPPLSSDNQSNWFTQNAPQALLYGSLLQSAPYLKNDERVVLWKSEFEGFLNSLKTEETERIVDRSAYVKGT